MTITLRTVKGSELTHEELDGNFTDLDGRVTGKQATLVSGVNIKTINGNSLLGSGDVVVGGATNLSYTASPTTGLVESDTGTDATLPLADGTNAGLMAPAQFTKLAGVAAGATANSTDATLLNRANHTGTQSASTISDSSVAGRAVLTAADAAAQRTALGLGTSATQAATSFATAAQGAKADTALQPTSPTTYVMFDGDSKAGEPSGALAWWAADNPCDIEVGASLGVGGSLSGSSGSAPVGLTNTTRLTTMSSTVSAQVALGKSVDLWLTIGTNDAGAAVSPETVVANVRIYYDAFVAAGGRYLFLMSVDPRGAGTAAIPAINAAYYDLARTRRQIIYVDSAAAWIDSTAATFDPIGGSAGGRFAVTYDGLHGSTYGIFAKKRPVQDAVAGLYRQKRVSPISAGDVYNVTTAPRANYFGAIGRFISIGGTSTATGGTVTGTPPSGWTVAGALNGVNVTFTTASSAGLQSRLGLLSAPACVNFALSGTASADTTISITMQAAKTISSPGAGQTALEFLSYLNAIAGISVLKVASTNMTGPPNTLLGQPGSGALLASDELPAITQMAWMGLTFNDSVNPFNFQATITLKIKSGVSPTGSIDLVGISLRKAAAIA